MSEKSSQHSIPKSRVQLFYETDTEGAKVKKELPQRELVIGDFTLDEDETELEKVKPIPVHKRNFNTVMDGMKLKLDIKVPNRINDDEEELEVKIDFNSDKIEEYKGVDKFRPEPIIKLVPELENLINLRSSLDELKRTVNNKSYAKFRRELERIMLDDKLTENLKLDIQSFLKDQGE